MYVDGPHGVGVSESWRIVGADKQKYLVKFNTHRDRTAINELVCNHVAECFELPVFEPVLVNLNDEQCKIVNDHRAANEMERIEPGEHFGTRLRQPFYTVDGYEKTFGSRISENTVTNLHRVPDILGFDSLIQNDDRHCGNVCVLEAETPGKLDYYIFDHSHAFGGPSWDARLIREMYQSMKPVSNFCMITSAIKRFDQFDKFLRMFDARLKKEIGGIFQRIPRGWRSQAAPDLKQLEESIRGTSRDDLATVIKNSRPLGGRMR